MLSTGCSAEREGLASGPRLPSDMVVEDEMYRPLNSGEEVPGLLEETVTHIPGANVSGKLDDRVGLHYTLSVKKELRHPRMRFHVMRDETAVDHYAAASPGGVASQKAWSEGRTRREEAHYQELASAHHTLPSARR